MRRAAIRPRSLQSDARMGMIRKNLVFGRADVTRCGQAAALPRGSIDPEKMLDVPGRIWQDNKTGRNLDFGNSPKVGLLWR